MRDKRVSKVPVLSGSFVLSWFVGKYLSGKVSEKAGWVKKGKGFRVALFNSLFSYFTIIVFLGLFTQAAREIKSLEKMERRKG